MKFVPYGMEINAVCQWYQYNSDNCDISQESETYFSENFDTKEIDPLKVHWLNFHNISNKDAIAHFFAKQGYDSLVLEDVYARLRRPKLEEYDEYLFFSLRSVLPPSSNRAPLEQEQLSFLLGKNYLISLQEKRSDFFKEVRDRIELKKGKIRDRGSDFLLFRLLDATIDNYYKVVEYVSERSRQLEPQIIDSADSDLLKEVEMQKRKLLVLRRIVAPLKDITLQLEKAENQMLSKENTHYFVDLKESCLGILDDIDSTINLLDGLTNLYYAVQGQRMNEIMKVLTVVSAIFIPLTFLAGIYGMNFANMPELQYKNGYFILLGVMFIVAIALIIYFIRKGWLKKG